MRISILIVTIACTVSYSDIHSDISSEVSNSFSQIHAIYQDMTYVSWREIKDHKRSVNDSDATELHELYTKIKQFNNIVHVNSEAYQQSSAYSFDDGVTVIALPGIVNAMLTYALYHYDNNHCDTYIAIIEDTLFFIDNVKRFLSDTQTESFFFAEMGVVNNLFEFSLYINILPEIAQSKDSYFLDYFCKHASNKHLLNYLDIAYSKVSKTPSTDLIETAQYYSESLYATNILSLQQTYGFGWLRNREQENVKTILNTARHHIETTGRFPDKPFLRATGIIPGRIVAGAYWDVLSTISQLSNRARTISQVLLWGVLIHRHYSNTGSLPRSLYQAKDATHFENEGFCNSLNTISYINNTQLNYIIRENEFSLCGGTAANGKSRPARYTFIYTDEYNTGRTMDSRVD